MAVAGKKREISGNGTDFVKKVGIFEAKVIAINPTAQEYKDILDIELKEDSKSTDYLGKTAEGFDKIRIDVWLQDVKSDFKQKVTFWLEDVKKVSKDGLKKQYINNVGITSWAADESELRSWFIARDYRVAYVGEEDFLSFLRIWLGGIDFRDESAELQLDWKKVIVNNLKEWKDEIGGEWCQTVGALATIKSSEKDGEVKSYQEIYNKAFFPGYSIRHMRMIDYNSPDVVRGLTFKKSNELKMHEKFVINVAGEYGCKHFYSFNELSDYDPENNLVESNKVIAQDDSEF
jgi:hypothetical protein